MNTPSPALPSLLTLRGWLLGFTAESRCSSQMFSSLSFFRGGGRSIHQIKSGCHKKILQELVSQGHWVPGLRQEAVASQPCLHQSWVCLQSPCACYSPPHEGARIGVIFFQWREWSFAQMLKVMALGRSRLPFSETPPRRKQV